MFFAPWASAQGLMAWRPRDAPVTLRFSDRLACQLGHAEAFTGAEHDASASPDGLAAPAARISSPQPSAREDG